MGRRNRSPEEQERRAKIRELLQLSRGSSMEDIQNLFKETIAEFMEGGLDLDCQGHRRYEAERLRIRKIYVRENKE